MIRRSTEQVVTSLIVQAYKQDREHISHIPEYVTGFAQLYSELIYQELMVDIKNSTRPQKDDDLSSTLQEIENMRTFDAYKYTMYRTLTKQWGWDDDVLPHLTAIDMLYGQFTYKTAQYKPLASPLLLISLHHYKAVLQYRMTSLH